MKKCIHWYQNKDFFCRKENFQFFLWGTSLEGFFEKNVFHRKYFNFVFIGSVFDVDYESDVILIKLYQGECYSSILRGSTVEKECISS